MISCLLLASILLFYIIYFRAKRNWNNTLKFGIISSFLAFSFGSTIHYFQNDINNYNHYSNFISEGKKTTFSARIIQKLKSNERFFKYEIEVNQIDTITTTGKIILYLTKETNLHLIPGDEIITQSYFNSLNENENPHQFSYAKYLKNQNIHNIVFVNDKSIIKTVHFSTLHSLLYKIKTTFSSSFKQYRLDTQTESVLNALLLGDKTSLDFETYSSFTNAGVIHILAISGLHIGILYLFLSFILKPLNLLKQGKIYQFTIVIGFLWFFAFITGMSPSVTRAVMMFSIIAIGKVLNRDNNLYNAIAVSALLLLIYNTNYLFDIGFQLSYAAVLSIVICQPFFKRFYFSKNKIIVYFIDIILVSLVAQLGVMPLSLYYFNQFPILFLVANLIVIPFTTAILIIGLLTLFFNFTLEFISNFLTKILQFLIELMLNYTNWIASFKDFLIQNISFTLLLTIVSYISIGLLYNWFYKKKAKAFQYWLTSIMLIQITYLGTKIYNNSYSELTVFNSKKTLIAIKNNDEIYFLTNDKIANQSLILNYKKGVFNCFSNTDTLRNFISYKENKILILDEKGYQKMDIQPDIILLIGNPKINLERVIFELKPKKIIADKSNSYYRIKSWETTCKEAKIPFHATAEKGFYKLN